MITNYLKIYTQCTLTIEDNKSNKGQTRYSSTQIRKVAVLKETVRLDKSVPGAAVGSITARQLYVHFVEESAHPPADDKGKGLIMIK